MTLLLNMFELTHFFQFSNITGCPWNWKALILPPESGGQYVLGPTEAHQSEITKPILILKWLHPKPMFARWSERIAPANTTGCFGISLKRFLAYQQTAWELLSPEGECFLMVGCVLFALRIQLPPFLPESVWSTTVLQPSLVSLHPSLAHSNESSIASCSPARNIFLFYCLPHSIFGYVAFSIPPHQCPLLCPTFPDYGFVLKLIPQMCLQHHAILYLCMWTFN